MARHVDTEKEIDRLYAAPPGEFVRHRDELARSLRSDGKREVAGEVTKLRKPTVAAWAVNQLARREKMRLRGLFTAGERLRAAHGEVLGGGSPEALDQARTDERRAVEELVSAARPLLEEAGHPPTDAMADRVRETLHAAAVDEAVGERVRRGRLEQEARATGFGFTSVPAAKGRKPARKAPREDARRRKRREAEGRLREANDALAEAEREVTSRRRDLEAAERELEGRRVAVERAERELERSR